MKQLMERPIVKYYGLSLVITLVCLTTMGVLAGGISAVLLTGLLSILEISLSFDNAVVNAVILKKVSHKWRQIFLTVGILIAVVGMRLVFPILIVQLTAHLGFFEVGQLAVNDPKHYGELLDQAHPVIAMFAGTYLAQIGLSYFFNDRETTWLGWLERPLKKIGRLDNLSSIVAGSAAFFMSLFADKDIQLSLIIAGFSSVLLYQVVAALNNVFENKNEEQAEAEEKEISATGGIQLLVGKAAFFSFLYLEVQDAMFSFDGVAGAFAITSSVLFITVGLFIGALFVRSMTIHFVETDKLKEFDYLENGAFWAILCLAGLMLASVFVHVGEVTTGVATGAFIVASLICSKYFPASNEDDDFKSLAANDESIKELANKA
jgi:hypothetical protein